MRTTSIARAIAAAPLLLLIPSAISGQSTSNLSIANYRVVAEQQISDTQARVTYGADLVNSGSALASVIATLNSLDPFSIRVVPGQDTLNFAPVPANNNATTSDLFTVVVAVIPEGTTGLTRLAVLDVSKIQWSFQATSL